MDGVRQISNFYYKMYSFCEWIKQLFKMAAGRHLEYSGPWQLDLDKFTQTDELIRVFECI